MGTEEYLKNFFESIDFLAQGEKIIVLKRAISISKKLRAEKKVEVPSELVFLLHIEPQEFMEVIGVIYDKLEQEERKVVEMLKVFKEFNAQIGKERLGGVSYPDNVKIEVKRSRVVDFWDIIFTFDGIEKWFMGNVLNPKRVPFRKRTGDEFDEKLIKGKAFGIVTYWANEKCAILTDIQPIVYYDLRGIKERIGKGVKPPLKRPHILMLFFALQKATKDGYGEVICNYPNLEVMNPTARDIYKEIARIAAFCDEGKKVAHFKKS